MNSYDFTKKLAPIRTKIIDEVERIMKELGGRICMRHYHEYSDVTRYTFFEVDGDGYGRELFLDTIYTNPDGTLGFTMSDSEDSYNPYWETADFNTSNALYLLEELEEVKELIDGGEKLITDYDPDFDWEGEE